MIGLPDAALLSRTAGALTQSRTAVRGCPHGSEKQFQVMVMREKNEEFSVLEIVDAQGNVAPKNGNSSRLFTGVREPRRGGAVIL